ncbi:MAG: YihA family ribosome biogenesis GTP-binding protein [Negativicutes bacterium]|jgi:GTP-binding protein|nr:YihA family ribosome biogenesis GTP-binding protein [Negativicutes bacterium]
MNNQIKRNETEAIYRISLAEYLISTVRPTQKPEVVEGEVEKDEIAFIGRSNVGKSSLINMFVQRKKLARVSGQPGKTRTINYYRVGIKFVKNAEIGKEFLLVDLPGYGYAKVSKDERKKWHDFVGGYLMKSLNLKQVFMLVDIRHEPQESDLLCSEVLHGSEIPFSVVLTKADKISKNQMMRQQSIFAKAFDVPKERVIISSAEEKIGRSELLNKVGDWLEVFSEDN